MSVGTSAFFFFIAFKNPMDAILIKELSIGSNGQLVQFLKSILFCSFGKFVKYCF